MANARLLERIAFRIALPFVMPQGLWVKLRARRFAPATGSREGTAGDGERFRLLSIGDSIVAGVGVEQLENALPGQLAKALAARLGRRVEWVARGVSGFDAVEVRRDLVPALADEPFDCIFVSVGVNDVTGLRTAGRWRREIVALVGDLRRHSPDALIVVSGLPPLYGFPLLPEPLRAVFGLRARTFDFIAEDLVSTIPDVLFVPNRFDPRPEFFSPDGYHPSAESCSEWASRVADEVMRVRASAKHNPDE
jgi:lysophospholipase L1-like esterase